MEDVLKLCDRVRGIAYAIHVFHGNGYLEKVYENAVFSGLAASFLISNDGSMLKRAGLFLAPAIMFWGMAFNIDAATVKVWQVHEVPMTATGSYATPYKDGLPDTGAGMVRMTFTGTSGAALGASYTITGFWDGGQNWKARFAPPASGTWSYASVSTDSGLNHVTGTLAVEEWTDADKAANPTRRGFVRVCKTGARPNRYFEYADGTPFFWLGDTWWRWANEDIYQSTFQALVDDRAAKGFNLGQMNINGDNVMYGFWAEPALLDYSSVDFDHITKIDERIAYANAKGITIWITGFWSRPGGSWVDCRRWCRYLMHRYGAYNVIWVISGEYDSSMVPQWREVGTMLDDEDPYERLISIHPQAWNPSSYDFHNDAWLDFNQRQTAHNPAVDIPASVASDYGKTPAKPIVDTEPHYQFLRDNVGSAHIRWGGWSAVLAGAGGHSYGVGGIWEADVPESRSPVSDWPSEILAQSLVYEGSTHLGYMAAFFCGIDWWKLEPRQDLIFGYSNGWCGADPGVEYVVYLRYGGGLSVNLGDTGAGHQFQYSWFNPRTGVAGVEQSVFGGAARSFTAPDVNDWVLHLRLGQDLTPPTISNVRSARVLTHVQILFSELVQESDAEVVANYSIDNAVTISSAELAQDERTVALTTSALEENVTYTLTVNNVADTAFPANVIAANTEKEFGYFDVDPALAGWWKLDETSGTTAADSSGNGLAGALSNGPAWTPGQIGRGLLFDGADDYVNIGNVSELNFERMNAFSGAAWIYPTDVSAESHSIMSKGGSISPYQGWNFDQYCRSNNKATSISLQIMHDAGNNYIEVHAPQDSIAVNQWYHVCFTYDGSSQASGVKLYINGVSQTTTIVMNTLSASIANYFGAGIGMRNGSLQPYQGKIDDVRIYNRALSATEVAALSRPMVGERGHP